MESALHRLKGLVYLLLLCQFIIICPAVLWELIHGLKSDPCGNQENVIFFEGKLYAAGTFLIEVDFDGSDLKARNMRGLKIKHTELERLKTYLVECSGNLLYVHKYGEISCDVKCHKTHGHGFEVYKFGKNDAETWSRIYDLGEHSLFLGWNESVAVLAGQIAWCRPIASILWTTSGMAKDSKVIMVCSHLRMAA